mmetsp:Transcript_16270/g.13914  ORF Transcript_16270/g.13914 Transcript_16270/m.13914 type:complete len:106 (+) Transcript_16270:1392-1709(+)
MLASKYEELFINCSKPVSSPKKSGSKTPQLRNFEIKVLKNTIGIPTAPYQLTAKRTHSKFVNSVIENATKDALSKYEQKYNMCTQNNKTTLNSSSSSNALTQNVQ